MVTVSLVEVNDNVAGTLVPHLVSYFVDVCNRKATLTTESDVAFIETRVENSTKLSFWQGC
jgi:hypothetical protein